MSFSPSRPTHPEEKMQGLAAVEATAEGDEDGSVSSPHSRPGWAGPAERILYFYQAPGPDPAHYHQGSSGPGWEGHRGGGGEGGGEGQGGREGEEGGESVSQRLQTQEAEGAKKKKETETATQTGRERGRGGKLEREWEMVRQGERQRVEGRHELGTGGWEGQSEREGNVGANRGACTRKPLLVFLYSPVIFFNKIYF